MSAKRKAEDALGDGAGAGAGTGAGADTENIVPPTTSGSDEHGSGGGAATATATATATTAATTGGGGGGGDDSSSGSSSSGSSSGSDSDSSSEDEDDREGYAAPTAGEVHLRVSALNPFLICGLCNGYFRDPMTSQECLHTFCKPCIFLYIRDGGTQCPQCKEHLGAKPRSRFLMDATLQGLINKLLPEHLVADAAAHEAFERERNGGANDKAGSGGGGDVDGDEDGDTGTKQRAAFEVVLRLAPTPSLPADQTLPALPKPFLRTSSALTLTNLKQYLALKFPDAAVAPEEIVLRCRGLVLTGKEHTLYFVMKTQWRDTNSDLEITYSRIDPVAAAAADAAAAAAM